MKEYKKAIQSNLPQIKAEIREHILKKYDLGDLHIADISFSLLGECPDGFVEKCRYFGRDSRGRPIIKCRCEPE